MSLKAITASSALSKVMQGEGSTDVKPLGQKQGPSGPQPSLCRIWQHAPFHMYRADHLLNAVWTGEGADLWPTTPHCCRDMLVRAD